MRSDMHMATGTIGTIICECLTLHVFFIHNFHCTFSPISKSCLYNVYVECYHVGCSLSQCYPPCITQIALCHSAGVCHSGRSHQYPV